MVEKLFPLKVLSSMNTHLRERALLHENTLKEIISQND